MIDLQDIFTTKVQADTKVRSISGVFFSEENFEHTNYRPAYQRNYVWDEEKASYFIESIFLGTEIPPLIYFKTITDDSIEYEIIDGRQRYESIIRFINNELRLKKKGMPRLGEVEGIAGLTYKELSQKFREIFEDTKIRIIEFFFHSEHTIEEEDAVKKEIFQRYNSGITPLKNIEVDHAQYLNNELNTFFKDELAYNKKLDEVVTRLFRFEKSSIDQKVMKIRELLVLYRIPIKYYAIQKQKVVKKYFELLSDQISEEEMEDVFHQFEKNIWQIEIVEKALVSAGINYNRLYSECLYWALSIVKEEKGNDVIFDLMTLTELVNHFKNHEELFTNVRSSFARELFERYKCTADFFEKSFDCRFLLYLYNNDQFKDHNQQFILPAPSYSSLSLDELRIHKADPTSEGVSEIIRMVKNGRFMIRPSYQRNEVANRRKSSSIIESLLLKIKLPPIFIFRRSDGIREVIDGQQRLLSILGYMGENYIDENGEMQKSFIDSYRLDLKENGILKECHGLRYSDLTKGQQGIIRSSDIWVIEIKEADNKNFDPIDLFVRLNNKPYPIAKDSFEMWNSFVSRDLIETIKSLTARHSTWFYLRKKSMRMDNENLMATLAYFQYCYLGSGMRHGQVAPERTIELYVTDKRIACRFKSRREISKLMEGDNHSRLYHALNILDFSFISNLQTILCSENCTLSELGKRLDAMLRFEIGRRTQMAFYMLWVLLHDLSARLVKDNADSIRNEVTSFIDIMQEVKDVSVYKQRILEFRDKYRVEDNVFFLLGEVATVFGGKGEQQNQEVDLVIDDELTPMGKFSVQHISGRLMLLPHQIGVKFNREGILPRYVECFLRSGYMAEQNANGKYVVGSLRLNKLSIPYIPVDRQESFCKILQYVDTANGLEKKYFERIMDLICYQQVYLKSFEESGIDILANVQNMPDLSLLENENKRKITVSSVYAEMTDKKSEMSLILMKAVDLDVFNS